MSISYVNSASAAATSVAMPAHQVGDLIIIYAFRDGSTTAPTIPANWLTNATTTAGTLCCAVYSYRVAASTSETTGTWTSATGISVAIYRKSGADEEWWTGIQAVTSTSYPAGLVLQTGASATLSWGSSTLSTSGSYLDECTDIWSTRFCGQRNATNLTTNSITGWTARSGTATETRVLDSNGALTVATGSVGTNTLSTNGSTGWITLQFTFGVTNRPANAQLWLCNSSDLRSGTAGLLPYCRTGDLVVAIAYRGTSATPPTVASGYTTITSGAASTSSYLLAYATVGSDIQTGARVATNTFANATSVQLLVFRKMSGAGSWYVPTSASGSGTGTTITYPDLTGGTEPHMFVRYSASAVTVNTFPSSWSRDCPSPTLGNNASNNLAFSRPHFVGDADAYGGDTATNSASAAWRAVTLKVQCQEFVWGSFSTLSDNFATQDSAKWNYYGSATATSGQAVVPAQLNGGSSIWSKNAFDLTGTEVVVEVPEVPAVGTGTTYGYLSLTPFNTFTDALWTIWDATGLHFKHQAWGGSITSTDVAYNSTTHRWWRIRESGGTIYWDTAPDGATWTNYKSVATPVAINRMMAVLYSGYSGTESGVGQTKFDNLNLPAGVPITTLTDAFTASDTAKWDYTNVSVGSGVASVTSNAAASVMQSDAFYNINNRSLTWQVTGFSSSSDTARMGVRTETGMWFGIEIASTGLARRYLNGTGGGSTHAHVNGDWYRISFDGSSTGTFEWSSNGYTWNLLSNLNSSAFIGQRMDRVYARFEGVWTTGTLSWAVDNVNLPPPPPLSLLVDDFESYTAPSVLDSSLWVPSSGVPDGVFIWDEATIQTGISSSINLTAGDQALVFAAEDAGTGVGIAGMDSFISYEADESSISCEVLHLEGSLADWDASSSGTALYFGLNSTNGTNAVNFYIESNGTNFTLAAVTGVSGVDTYIGTATYSPTAHRWLRMREASGTLYWEYSADAVSWSQLASASTATALVSTSCAVSIGVYTLDADVTPALMIIDNVNVIRKTSSLTDDFTTLDTSAKWDASGTVTPTVSSGRLNLTYNAVGGAITGTSAYDLTDSSMSIRLVDGGAQSSGEQRTASMKAWRDDFVHNVGIELYDNTLTFRYWNGSTNNDTSTAYSSTTHAYWRIREVAGTTYWDTSSDGYNWTNRRSLATPFAMSSVKVEVNAFIWGTGTGGVVTKWDNFNCRPLVESVIDDFSDYLSDTFATQDNAKWSYNGTAAVSSGELLLTPNSSYTNAIYGNVHYDLIGASMSVACTQAPNVGNGSTEAYFTLEAGSNANCVVTMVTNNYLFFRERVGGVTSDASIAYNSTDHRYWRIRESGGNTYWDTSPDGTTWTNRRSKTSGINMTNLTVGVVAGYWGTEPSPGTAKFDNFSLKRDVWTFGGATAVTGGQLSIPCDAAWSDYTHTVNKYDFTGSSVSCKLGIATGGTTPITYGPFFMANSASHQNEIGVLVSGGAIYLGRTVGGSGGDSGTYTTYNATNHRYVRLRESSGTVYLDVSASGAAGTWTQIDSYSSSTLDLTSGHLAFFGGTSSGTASNITVDDVNIAGVAATTPTNLFFPFFS